RLARNDREHDPRLLLRRDHRRPSHQQPPGISDADHALTTGLPEILTRDNPNLRLSLRDIETARRARRKQLRRAINDRIPIVATREELRTPEPSKRRPKLRTYEEDE
ncbi:MAG: hypothetical protein J0H96_14040, partial [Microbacterium ginsengisoli]|nr:hypothetical protein [Microbacterium ginsengisoli]